MDSRRTAICVASKKLRQAKENVVDQLKNVEDCILSLHTAESSLDHTSQRIQRRLEAEVELVVKLLNERKLKLLNELKLDNEEKHLKIAESIQFARDLSAKTKEAIVEANSLELECDQVKFFQQYSSISVLLDDRFVDLVLLSDKTEGKLGFEKSYQLDFQGIIRDLELHTTESDNYSEDNKTTSSDTEVNKQTSASSTVVEERTICGLVSSPGEHHLPRATESVTPSDDKQINFGSSEDVSSVICSSSVGKCEEQTMTSCPLADEDDSGDIDDVVASQNTSANSCLSNSTKDVTGYQSHLSLEMVTQNEINSEENIHALQTPGVDVGTLSDKDIITDEGSHDLCDESRCERGSLTESVGRDIVSHIQFLELISGMDMMVYVTEVTNPHHFIVQPQSTELVDIMKAMGEEMDENTGCYEPVVGEFCCAQFSEDECWYRAKVLDVITDNENLAKQARILFVDYGNEEVVRCDAIRSLQPKFCRLPCQSITCSLANILPIDPSVAWTEDISVWFSSLLFGSTLKISVVSCTGPNIVSVDAFLPVSRIADSLLTNFDTIAITDHLEEIPVTLFVCQAGLATQRRDIILSPQSGDSVHSDAGSINSVSSEMEQIPLLSLSDLPSLMIKLTESNEFMCLLSVISPDMTVYVHPADMGVAHSITSLNSILQNHYSLETNHIPIPSSGLRNGALCVVFSQEFNEWCRAVIVAVHSDMNTEKDLNCLVFFIDYGGSLWESSSKLFVMCTSLSKFPATIICCHLGEDQELPIINNEVLSSKMYSDEPEISTSKLAESITAQINNKPLVAVIRIEQESMDWTMMLCTRVSHVLPVQLYDTTGNTDVLVNDLLAHAMIQFKSGRSEDGDINIWNPMEHDFLSGWNQYLVDDEDAGTAFDGFKTTKRVCRYFSRPGGCYRGDSCPHLHLHEGVSNRQLEETVVDADSCLELPNKNDWIVVVVTAIVSATRFYVQLPLGLISPLVLSKGKNPLSSNNNLEEDLNCLIEAMTTYYNKQVFTEREIVSPETGEMVAARYLEDECWYRARVLDVNKGNILIFFVDYGNTSTVEGESLRKLQNEFLILPFQAVECCFPSTLSSNHSIGGGQAQNALEPFVMNQSLVAKVIGIEGDGVLCVELFRAGQYNDSDTCINDELTKLGLLEPSMPVKSKNPSLHSQSSTVVMRPG